MHRVTKRFVLLASGLGLAIVCTALVNSATHRPASQPAEIPKDRPLPIIPREMPVGAPPGARQESAVFDFGVMDFGSQGEHEYRVWNEGPGELKLVGEDLSCQCLGLEYPQKVLAPGEEMTVRLTWKVDKPGPELSQGALIYTNDPQRTQLKFGVRGRVVQPLGCQSEKLIFSGLNAHEPRTIQTVVFSQSWTSFRLVDVTNDLGLSWQAEPASSEELSAANALSGYRISLTLPAGRNPGAFGGELRVHVADPVLAELDRRLPAGQQPTELVVPVMGRVMPDFDFLGRQITDEGVLDLGQWKAGQAQAAEFYMIVRSTDHDLRLKKVFTDPDYLQVEVEFDRAVSETMARYRVRVSVPADAPAETRMGARAALIRVASDHPLVPQAELIVEFGIY